MKTQPKTPSRFNKRNGRTCFRIARIYHKRGDHDTSTMYMFRALDCEPNRANYWNYMGRLFFEIKDYNAAKHYFQKALLKDPDYTPARLWLANVYLEEDDWPKLLHELDSIDEFSIHHVLFFPKPLLGLFCYTLSSGSPTEAGEPLPAGDTVATSQRPPCIGL